MENQPLGRGVLVAPCGVRRGGVDKVGEVVVGEDKCDLEFPDKEIIAGGRQLLGGQEFRVNGVGDLTHDFSVRSRQRRWPEGLCIELGVFFGCSSKFQSPPLLSAGRIATHRE